ncbi:MAG: hypothetical protein A2902_03535 [Elusimicrobia bacterium RIFCSPLOWO2_01_FULL_64_13]|nr:MAG: hypothetical protein A2902_03535 [Elusimicrobia bacterium RIFCSPLOWO2_01_FULL_64_13]
MKRNALGTHDIAQICQVTPATVGNWIEKGLLPVFTTGGGHRRAWPEDVVAFLKTHNIPVPEELKAQASPRILIVDDEEPVRNFIRRALQKIYPAVEIQEAADGFEAGHKLGQLTPSLVVLDLKLPGIDGFKVCGLIRSDERLKETRILAISGHNQQESERQSLAAGADAFLGKPFDAAKLREKVSLLLS